MKLQQAVRLQNNNNTRHFGGYHTCDSRIVKQKKVIRSGLPNGFSQSEMNCLKTVYRLHTIVDFRGKEEIEKAPVKQETGIEYIPLSLIDEDRLNKNIHAADTRSDNVWMQIFEQLGGTAEAVKADMCRTYIGMLESRFSQEQLRRFFDILLNNEEGCVLFHCTGGKDRTGIAALLLLLATGVPWETCVQDYMLTNLFWKDYIEQEVEKVRCEMNDPETEIGIRSLLGVDSYYLEQTRIFANKEYGGIEHYIRDILKLDTNKTELLKSLYTE